MKPIIHHLLIGTALVLVTGVLVAAIVLARQQKEERVCPSVDVEITDAEERSYVTSDDIVSYIQKEGLNPVGKNVQDISSQVIEDMVNKHPVVRHAECYITNEGIVHIRLHQRVPLLRVVTAMESYYIDQDRKKMPFLPYVKSDAMVVTGHVGERMAKEEIGDMVEWIDEHPYWKERITRISIGEGKQLTLRQKEGEPYIIMGDIAGYQKKLKKLRILQEKKPQDMEMPLYQAWDLRYDKQVIGRK